MGTLCWGKIMLNRRNFITAASLCLSAPSLAWGDDGAVIKLRDLYNRDRSFSDLALENEGQTVRIEGFMAPPLKADSRFFVLTKQPMAVCPFCETEAEWPDNIIAVYTQRKFRVVSFNRKIETIGQLALGKYRDSNTGFLSLMRIENARFEIS